MFFISFFHKVSSFLFSCISFKYVLFNCFLRSRCSMEMWCPDDKERDSWDWVGPPAWVRACFNSPEWCGGSSPVKTEPPQIVLLLLLCRRRRRCCCCCCQRLTKRGVYVHSLLRTNCAEALDDKELFIIEGSENWRSTPGQPGGARKMPTPASPPYPR